MKKLRFKSGVGEALEFAAVFPFVFLALMFIIALFQVTTCEEKLIYAAYMGGRAAVVSFDSESAQKNAEDALNSIFATEDCDIEVVTKGVEWVKGNVALIKVSQELNPIFPYQWGMHTRQIGMMIEHSYWVTLK